MIDAVKVVDPKGLAIDEELKKLYSENRIKLSIDELKSFAPNSYRVLFDAYEPDEDNGIQTTYYSVIEKEDNIFHISKN